MTQTQRIVVILLALSILAGVLTGDQLYYRLIFLWALLLFGTWIFTKTSLRGIKVFRKARFLRSQVGLLFEERYEIRNTGRLPRLWIEVRDNSSLPNPRASFVISMLGGHESRSFNARSRLVERGVFQLGPTILSSGDPFGLFSVSQTYENDDVLLVYPLMVDVDSFPNPPGLLPGGDALRRRTAQITSNAAGVREYVPGDPLNRIHWLSTAKRGHLMAKEFELDPMAEVWIFVDAFKHVHYGKGSVEISTSIDLDWRRKVKFKLPPSTIEYCVSIAASLAKYYLQRQRAVGLVFASSGLRVLPSDRGARQLNKILESLATLQPVGEMPLEGIVEIQARYMPRGSTVVVITPSTSDTVFRTADLMLRRGLRPILVSIDASTFGGPSSPEKVSMSVELLGIPVCRVARDDNLSEVLSKGVSELKKVRVSEI